MRWMAMVLGLGLVCAGCKDDKKDEPVEVASDEAKAEEGEKKDEAEEEAAKDESASDGETKTAKADEDEKDEDEKDEDDKDEDEKDEDGDEEADAKTANADDAKPTSTAASKAAPFGAGGLSACCAALDVQSKSTSGSNASRIAAASRQCFHLDGLVAQGKTTKAAALAQLKALSGVAPAACN
ncbi:MAG: hypothetical protein RIF41_03780 [Polyangiaceae bacterium]